MSSRSLRSSKGAFHDYVRGVFAENSVRARLLRASRARWLHGFSGLNKFGVRAGIRFKPS